MPVPAEGSFTYSVPAALEHLVMPGMRVQVAFAGRRLTGTVVATRVTAPAELSVRQIRPIADCLDPLPLLSPQLLALTRWIAEVTMSSWGDAIRTALPAGLARAGDRRATLTPEGNAVLQAGEAPLGEGEHILRALKGAGGNGLRLSTLGRRVETAGVVGVTYSLAQQGLLRVEDEWSDGGGRQRRAVRRARHLSLEQAQEVSTRAPAQRRIVDVLWEQANGLGVRELLEQARCGPTAVRALLDKGVIEGYRQRFDEGPVPAWEGGADGAGSFKLTAPQAEALSRIESGLGSSRREPLLLHGVTGSGKTEVYLRAARRAVELDRTAILLVPEIGLTPLLEHRARAVLGDRVAVLHSGMAASERLAVWWQARRGRVPVIIGPRSAVFAPLEDVGLIVVDEEQDAAYKQDERPRYHGRDVALRRAELEGAVVVLGSATPALESYHRSRRGTWELARLPERVASRPMPVVRLVDMRREWQESGRTLLSAELEEALADRLERGEQAMLLLNRRGFAAALRCRACGERVECPDCAVSLTLHQPARELRCHYCDYRAQIPSACPHCGTEALHRLGFGTQRLQSALQQRFPAAKIGRFDADETRRKGAHGRILSTFARGEIDLLVGTQMLAKGHDFPGVTLVGVVGADASLGFPDFRAAERTFQLLTQMAGRAGRGEAGGLVVLQAHQPDHYAILAAVDHDYEGFYEREIEYRRRLEYPPFTTLIACVCRGKVLPAVKEEADHLAAAIRRVGGSAVRVLGPASPPLARLRGRHRLQLLLRGPDAEALRSVLKEALENCRSRGVAPRDMTIDVDPIDLM